MPPDPPIPVDATISGSTYTVVVTFDRALKPGSSAKANWNVKADVGTGPKQHSTTGNGVIAGNTVTIPTSVGGITFPPLGVSYAATPADVISAKNIPADPFLDYPLRLVA